MDVKYYGINIYSVLSNVEYKKICFDYNEAFKEYKKEVKRLKKYKIINKVDFFEEYEEQSIILKSIQINKQIEHEKLSFFSYRKLYELFKCITSGYSYYREGEYDHRINKNGRSVDRRKQFLTKVSLANAEYRRLIRLDIDDFYYKSSGVSIGNFIIKLERWIYNHLLLKRILF